MGCIIASIVATANIFSCSQQQRPYAVKAISGNIDLQFLGGADARFRASSISGGIESKLKLEEMESKKGYGSATLSGRIGAGKGKVTLSTISGEITIR